MVGGLRLDEPATDLPVAMSLISSLKDTPIADDALTFGEIGLAGEIRSVSQAELRISEAIRLGFKKCVIPYHNFKTINVSQFSGVEIRGVRTIRQAFEALSHS